MGAERKKSARGINPVNEEERQFVTESHSDAGQITGSRLPSRSEPLRNQSWETTRSRWI